MATVSIADQLKVLLELQQLDSQIYRVKRELSSKPAEAARLKEAAQKQAEGVKATEAKYKALEVKHKEMEIDLTEKENQIKKLQMQLFQVKTNKEYTAMSKEIEGLKADKSVLEEEILKFMEEAEKLKALLAQEKSTLAIQEKELQEALARIQRESDEAQRQIGELKVSRDSLTPKVDTAVLSRYERILERKEGLALVPIKGDACGGCHMILPPQVINEIQMGSHLVTCESCARILTLEPSA